VGYWVIRPVGHGSSQMIHFQLWYREAFGNWS